MKAHAADGHRPLGGVGHAQRAPDPFARRVIPDKHDGGRLAAAHTGAAGGAQGPEGAADVSSIRRIMWDRVGLVRDAAGLASAIRDLAALEAGGASRPARDLALVGRLVATSALAREESRGAHWRTDWPEAREAWRRRSFVRLAADGGVEPVTEPAAPFGRAAAAAGSAA